MPGSKKTFAVGDQVTWSSQAGAAYAKRKTGVVAELVPPGKRPDAKRFPSLYRGAICGLGRPELSYIVRVGNRIYWPRTKHLQDQVCPESGTTP
jgi:hypothetical protein